MPTLNIGGQRVKVDDAFLQLSPEQQNATVEEIARSLSPPAPAEQPSVVADVAKSAGAGLAEGTIGVMGLPRTLSDLGGMAADKVAELIRGHPLNDAERAKAESFNTLQPPSAETIQRNVEGVTGEFHKPQTTAGEYVRTAAEFVPGAITAGGGLSGALKYGVVPGLASEGAGQATDGSKLEPYARMGGAILAGGVMAGGDAIAQGIRQRRALAAAPGPRELENKATSLFDAARQEGAMFDANSVDLIPAQMRQNLAAKNRVVSDRLTPAAADALRDVDETLAKFNIQNLAGQAPQGRPVGVSLDGVVEARKRLASFWDAAANKSDRSALKIIQDTLDDWINQAPDTALISGGDKAVDLYRQGNDAFARSARLGEIERAVKKADLRAASTGSGGNVDNATRQEIRRVLEKGRGFTPEERVALERVVRGGGVTQDMLRLAGKLSPQGSGLMAALGIGSTAINPMAAVPFAAGAAAKAVADGATARNLAVAKALIGTGKALPSSGRDARLIALMLAGTQPLRSPVAQ